MAGTDTAGVRHILRNSLRAVANLHRAASKHITGADEHWITNSLGNPDRVVCLERGAIWRTHDTKPVDEFAEPFAVFGDVDHLRRRTQYWHTGFFKLLCQFERRLTTKSDDHAIWFFEVQHVHYILERE